LGTDLRDIAREKAAIIKEGTTLFTAPQQSQVEEVIDHFRPRAKSDVRLSREINYRVLSSSPQGMVFEFFDRIRQENFPPVRLNLLGEFQIENALLAYLCSRWYLEENSIRFDRQKVYNVFNQIEWPGRLQRVSEHPRIYFDVSHNYAGFKATLDFIRSQFDLNSVILLLGLLADKEYDRIIQLLLHGYDRIVLTEPNSDRKLDGEIFKAKFRDYGKEVELIRDLQDAYDSCLLKMGDTDILFVMGSHFLVGELSKRLQEKSLTSK
jgi:dihydrofolate synthase/folylpolyglutamate synthase